jgi:hypothetical protein
MNSATGVPRSLIFLLKSENDRATIAAKYEKYVTEGLEKNDKCHANSEKLKKMLTFESIQDVCIMYFALILM